MCANNMIMVLISIPRNCVSAEWIYSASDKFFIDSIIHKEMFRFKSIDSFIKRMWAVKKPWTAIIHKWTYLTF